MSDPIDLPELQATYHWPHSAESRKRLLDLDALEPFAVRVLARGLLSQRLVAFVGAGVSACYGRMTWAGLMASLWNRVDSKDLGGLGNNPRWTRLRDQLWGKEKSFDNFMSYRDHALKAQVLADMLRLITPKASSQNGDPDEAIHTETKFALENFHGFVEWFLDEWTTQKGTEGPQADRLVQRSASIKIEDDFKRSANPPAAHGLQAILELALSGGNTGSLDPKELIKALTWQSVNLDSPLRLLSNDWGVRRFLTTNYDREIERGLEAQGFVEDDRDARTVQANRFRRLNFGRQETGQALGFALEGPRRHAAVLHLHGDVTEAKSLIVTESDYQKLYLDDHPLRDLVTNATLANFGANPVLFVGSDVSEDDVLRPMRQFMSGDGHRRDRMAVALFLTSADDQTRAQKKVLLWQKYGVFAVDVGYANLGSRRAPLETAERPWLEHFLALQQSWRKAAKKEERQVVLADLGTLPQLIDLEGVSLGLDEIDKITSLLSRLKDLLSAAIDDAVDQSLAKRRAQAAFDAAASWIGGLFLCAKLIDLRRRAAAVIEEDRDLALTFSRRKTGGAASEPLVVRHAVMLEHPELGGRFRRISTQAEAVFDEHIAELCKSIEAASSFQSSTGRRVLIVCASRGHGKGAQFDRLAARTGQGEDVDHGYMRVLLNALTGYRLNPELTGATSTSRVVHMNLSFSNELGPVISQVIGVMNEMTGNDEGLPGTHDQLELLGRAMHRLSTGKSKGRMLLILGNAGVLFGPDGAPKNGQIRRVMRKLLSPRFRTAPLDIMMYVNESQMPEFQRISQQSAPSQNHSDDGRAKGPAQDMRQRRRLHRLNIEGRPPVRTMVLVHPLQKTRVSELAQAYFVGLSQKLGWLHDSARLAQDRRFPEKGSESDDMARRLYFATGGSRVAQTMLLCWLEVAMALPMTYADAPPTSDAPDLPRGKKLVDFVCSSLRSAPSASAVEACVEFVLDQWASWHNLKHWLPASVQPGLGFKPSGPVGGVANAVQAVCSPMSPEVWGLANELLWHLSAFTYPVEAGVLIACPRVSAAFESVNRSRERAGIAPLAASTLVLAVLELLTHWCLVFRVNPRPMPIELEEPNEDGISGNIHRIRYSTHRHIQRHFLRLMGGRNLEATAWDQYTTTLYGSLPDESPALPPEVHMTLVQVIQALSNAPSAASEQAEEQASADAAGKLRMVHSVDKIRAAYFLVRSTYSLGVVSHLSAEAAERVGGLGHLEQYRRLVRWITHAARYWERRHHIKRSPPHKGIIDGEDLANGWCGGAGGAPEGIFYPGELVWLYNECGVISLAQGKLHDAEQLLSMAEAAARMVESDDTGSLHTRIRLHSALVQIERGRPIRAAQILRPMAARRHGHPVPPWLAVFYLGLIDHLGGSYNAADLKYREALAGFRKVGRSRAAAFVLANLADVQYSLNKSAIHQSSGQSGAEQALSLADEAVSLAQQGGHEDLRVMATVSRARICIDAGRIQGESLFEILSFAQRYAVLMDMPRLTCDVHELRARLLMRQGEHHLSANDATTSLEIAAMYDLKLKKARGLLTLAEIYLHRGEVEGARSLCTMGREIAVSCDYFSCVRGFKELELRLFPTPTRR